MKVTTIIPTLNEIDSIEEVLKGIPKDAVDEIIVVDGYSTDGTPELVKKLGYKVIFQEAKGYGSAVATGVRHATGDIITLVDGDGAYELNDIHKLVQCIKDGYDIAYGSRYLPGSGSDDDTLVSYIGNKLFTFLLNKIHRVKISDSLFLYVAARKEVFEKVKMKSANFEYCMEFPIKSHKAGFKYTEIPSFEKKRLAGKSKVNALLHGLRILWTIIRE